MKRLLLTATIMLAFAVAACTSSSVHNGIEGSAMRLSLDVWQSDFLTDSTETTETDSTETDSKPQTRATETAFQKDDVMGLFVHTAATVGSSGNHSSNVKYVAKDASSWQAAGGLGGELVKGTAYKVTAYYPYKENAANALAIEHAVATDQSSAFNAAKAGALELSDFMIAAPTAITGNFATTPAAELTFSHKLAKIVVSVGVPHSIEGVDVDKVQSVTILNLKTRCTINIATGAVSAPTDAQDITPRLVEGTGEARTVSKWEAIVVPQTVAAGTLMVRIVCLLKDATTKDLTYTVPASAPLTIVQSKKLTLMLSSAADLAITKGLELVDGIAKSALELGVKATIGAKWTLTSPEAWITLSTNNTTYTTSITGTGTGLEQVVYVTIGANPSMNLPRNTVLTLSDVGGATTTHEVVQNYFSLQAVDATITGGTQSAAVEAFASNQVWTATSATSWLKLSATAAGAGSNRYGPHVGALAANALYYQAEANNTNADRTATVSYASNTPGSPPSTTTITQGKPVLGVNIATQNLAPHITSAIFYVTTPSNQNKVTYTPMAGANATSVTPSTVQTVDTSGDDYWKAVTVGFTQNTTATARSIVATIAYGTSLTATHTITQAGIVLTGSNPSTITQPNGSTTALSFTGSQNIAWTISAKPTWITASPASGSATGAAQAVTLTATENATGANRTETLTIKMGSVTKDFSITQTASTITISAPAAAMIAAASSTPAFTVTVGSGTPWTVTNNSGGWLTNTTASGTGSGAAQTVTLTATANNTNAAREATVTVTAGGKTVTCKVTQVVPVVGNFSNSFASVNGTAALWGSTGRTVTPASGLQWKLTGDAGVTVSPTASPQTGAVTNAAISVGANNTDAARTLSYHLWYGTLASLKTSYTITQAAPVVGVSAINQGCAAHVTSATFNVTTSSNQNGVIYTPVAGQNVTSIVPSTAQTIDVTGNYSKTVTVNFAQNTSYIRNIVATVKYGASLTATHTITQAGIEITGSNPAAIGQINGSTTTLTFTGNQHIAWSISAKPAWITANSSSGTATGAAQNITLTATENTAGAVRTGVLTIKMGTMTKDFTITQNTSSISISATSAPMTAAAASSQAFTVTVSNGTPWTVTNSSGGWMTNTTASGVGNGAAQGVTLTAIVNPENTPRAATVTVTAGGKTVTCLVTQHAPVVNISATTQSVAAHVTSATFNVTTASNQNGVTYTPIAGANATSVVPNTVQTITGTGNYSKAVTVNFAQNTTTAARSIVATVKHGWSLIITHTITQAGLAAITGSDPATIGQSNGAKTTLTFTGTASIPWTISAKPDWITPSPASGSATGAAQAVTLTATEYVTASTGNRTGTLTIKMGSVTKNFTVTQYSSSIAISTANASMTAATASAQLFTVNVSSGTPWTVSNNSGGWLTNTTASGTGNGMASGSAMGVTLSAAANNTNAAREATVTVTAGGKTVTCKVTQAAPVINISATTQSVAPHITSATFNVTTSSNQNGVTYTPFTGTNATSVVPNTAQAVNVTGNYSKAVTVNFTQNTGAARNIVANFTYGRDFTKTHTITQAAPALSLSKYTESVAASATSVYFTLSSNVPYTSTYSSGGSSSEGAGAAPPYNNRGVTFRFPAQGSSAAYARTHTMTFNPNPNSTVSSQTRTFTVTQAAVPPTLTISSSSPGENIPRAGKSYYINIESNSEWRVSSNYADVAYSSGSGSTQVFEIKIRSHNMRYSRYVSVVFTSTHNAGYPAVTREWNGSQESGVVPAGCFPNTIPGYPDTFVALSDYTLSNGNRFSTYTPAVNNCRSWGGRLANINELLAIHTDGSYGSFISNNYWSSTFNSNTNKQQMVWWTNGGMYEHPTTTEGYVRCMKDA